MYKETDGGKVKPLVVLMFVAVAFLSHIILGLLPIPNLIKDIAFMAIMVTFVYVLMKKYVISYQYELTDDRVILTARLGSFERARAEIEYGAIECFGSVDDGRLNSYETKVQPLCNSKENNYAIICETDLGRTKIIFAPTEKFVSILENKLSEEE